MLIHFIHKLYARRLRERCGSSFPYENDEYSHSMGTNFNDKMMSCYHSISLTNSGTRYSILPQIIACSKIRSFINSLINIELELQVKWSNFKNIYYNFANVFK